MNIISATQILQLIENKISDLLLLFKKQKAKLQECLDASTTNFRMTAKLAEYSREVQNTSAALMVWHHLKDIANAGSKENWNPQHLGKLMLQELVRELNPNLFGFNDDEVAALRVAVPKILKEFTE